MGLVSRIIVFVITALFLLIGMIGTFQPLRLATQLGFELPTDVAVGQFRAMVGAPYLAMAIACLIAGLRKLPILLFPIGLIEALMVVARVIAAANGEFDPSVIPPTVLEVGMSGILLAISWPSLNKS